MQKLICPVAAALAAAVGLALLDPGVASATTQTLTPVADAYVSESTPTTPTGSATSLYTDGSPFFRSYLRFDLSGVAGTVTKATLRVYAVTGGAAGEVYDVHGSSDTSWSESGITYSNAPAFGATVASSGALSAGAWTSVDVTSLVHAGAAATVVLTTNNVTRVRYTSRETTTSPQLVVDYVVGTPPSNTSLPTISGTAQQGQTLTASSGTWSGTQPISYAYQWRRCDSAGGACANVAGATAQTYALTSSDVGSTLRVVVTGSNSAGSSSGTSAQTAVVQAVAAPPSTQPSLPIRAAFYYPWFPESWSQSGIYPFTHYTPTLGLYDSGSTAVIQQHVRALEYGNFQAGIASWWGQGSQTDSRIPALLQTTGAIGSPLRWTIYYEPEGTTDPSQAQVAADLAYIRDHYGNDRSYLRIGGRFVVFVYNANDTSCAVVDKWKAANAGINAYLVMKVFVGFRTCASQPDGWHQYGPAVAADSQTGYSYGISPGFYKAGEATPRLARDLTRWSQNVADMTASQAPFQLVTTFDEWGEGTSVESAQEWSSSSGFGAYLDVLHSNGGAPPPPSPPSPTPPQNTAPPTISGTAQQGQTLTASPGTWSGTTPITYAYQWRRCDNGGNACADVAGATAQSYTLVAADVGATMRVVVTAANSAGSGTATSAQTAVVVALGSPPPPPPSSGPCGTAPAPPAKWQHVIWIWFENHSNTQVVGNSAAPYFTQLSNQCGYATDYHGVTHPSLPNYIAGTSGDTWGIADDNGPSSHPIAQPSIFSQVKAAGMQWRSYQESMPSNCALGSSGSYAVKHNPAAYYTGIRTDCNLWDIPMGSTSSGPFLNDLNNNTLPAYSFITPNMCNDMHDCAVATGDSWLKGWMTKILASPGYQAGSTAVFVTFDEDDFTSVNRVAMIVVSPSTPAGARSGSLFNHYSLLKTSEQMLGLSPFLAHANDAGTASMRSAFGL
jgi:phosphatidylinositol-3-phosphatase